MGFTTFEDFERSLTNHSPNQDQIDRIEKVREAAKHYAATIFEQTPTGSRERSLALTNLEDSVMWAVKDIILN